jgi:hypothetical protein
MTFERIVAANPPRTWQHLSHPVLLLSVSLCSGASSFLNRIDVLGTAEDLGQSMADALTLRPTNPMSQNLGGRLFRFHATNQAN